MPEAERAEGDLHASSQPRVLRSQLRQPPLAGPPGRGAAPAPPGPEAASTSVAAQPPVQSSERRQRGAAVQGQQLTEWDAVIEKDVRMDSGLSCMRLCGCGLYGLGCD